MSRIISFLKAVYLKIISFLDMFWPQIVLMFIASLVSLLIAGMTIVVNEIEKYTTDKLAVDLEQTKLLDDLQGSINLNGKLIKSLSENIEELKPVIQSCTQKDIDEEESSKE